MKIKGILVTNILFFLLLLLTTQLEAEDNLSAKQIYLNCIEKYYNSIATYKADMELTAFTEYGELIKTGRIWYEKDKCRWRYEYEMKNLSAPSTIMSSKEGSDGRYDIDEFGRKTPVQISSLATTKLVNYLVVPYPEGAVRNIDERKFVLADTITQDNKKIFVIEFSTPIGKKAKYWIESNDYLIIKGESFTDNTLRGRIILNNIVINNPIVDEVFNF